MKLNTAAQSAEALTVLQGFLHRHAASLERRRQIAADLTAEAQEMGLDY